MVLIMLHTRSSLVMFIRRIRDLSFQSLDLRSNRISCVGCCNFALATGYSIQSIDLRYNSIGDNGITALLDELTPSTCLRKLYLGYNEIHEHGAVASYEDGLK